MTVGNKYWSEMIMEGYCKRPILAELLSSDDNCRLWNFLTAVDKTSLSETDLLMVEGLQDIMTYSAAGETVGGVQKIVRDEAPPDFQWCISCLKELNHPSTSDSRRSELRFQLNDSNFERFGVYLLKKLIKAVPDKRTKFLYEKMMSPELEDKLLTSFGSLDKKSRSYLEGWPIPATGCVPVIHQVVSAYWYRGNHDDKVQLFRWILRATKHGTVGVAWSKLQQLAEVNGKVGPFKHILTLPKGGRSPSAYVQMRAYSLLCLHELMSECSVNEAISKVKEKLTKDI